MTTSPALRELWNAGQMMAFSGLDGPTSYADGLVARSTAQPPGLEIRDPALCRVVFDAAPSGEIVFGGDYFSVETALGTVRGAFLDAHHLLLEGPCSVTDIDATLCTLARKGHLLIGVAAKVRPTLLEADLDDAITSRGAWLTERARNLPEGVDPARRRTLIRALTMMKSQVYGPEGKLTTRWTTPDRWPHKDMWLWDSGFHAIGWRHLDVAFARELLGAMFEAQGADGFIPHRVSPTGAMSDITQPPILAFAAQQVLATAPDLDWLRAVYPKLAAYLRWDLAHRDTDGGGLLEWYIEEHIHCRSGESGMDNSPRFDEATQLDAVDFNAFAALECDVLAEFAETLGLTEDGANWRREHTRLCALINERLWDEEAQFYCDYDPATGQRTPVLSSAGFLPLICGAASPAQAAALARHLADPTMFATAVPLPSIAARDTPHYSKDMWRGPVWININWFIARGLRRYGLEIEARALETASIAEIERQCEKYGTFFEYYDDRAELDPPQLERKGPCDSSMPYHQVMHDFGWTATLYVDWVLRK